MHTQHPVMSSSSPQYQMADSGSSQLQSPLLFCSKGALYPQKTDTEQISHKTKTVGLGTEGSQVDYFKRNYLLLSVFSDKKEDLAVLAFGSLLPVGHSFSFLVLHLLPLVGPAKESSCGRTCGSFRLPIGSHIRLPINTLLSPPCSNA